MLYGGPEQVHFHVNEVQLNKLVFTPETYRLKFEVGSTTTTASFRTSSSTRSPTESCTSTCFSISPDKPIRVKLPVRTTGTSEGVRNGGRLHVVYRRFPVSGLADQIPEDVSVDISPLRHW